MYFCLTAIRKVVPLSPNLLAILSISGAKKEEMWAPNLQDQGLVRSLPTLTNAILSTPV